MGDRAGEYLDWYLSGTDKQLRSNVNNCQWELMVLSDVATLLQGNEQAKKYQAMLDEKFAQLRVRLGR
jgi:hypothetical protein